MKCLVIGGHIAPAIAFTQQALSLGHVISYIGREFTNRKTKNKSPEKDILSSYKVAFDTYDSIKFNRHQPLRSILKLPLFFKNLTAASNLLKQHQPDVVVSFGSYIAVPLCIAATLKGIPVVTHEQTAQAGLANRLIARISTAVAISFESSRPYFPKHKTHLTGLLLRKHIIHPPKTSTLFPKKPDIPIITIIGGSQGSHTLNQTLKPLIPKLVKEYTLVHQVGSAQAGAEFDSFKSLKQSLPKKLQANYHPKQWVSEKELGWLYQHSRGFIARAGANTVAELYYRQVPAILVPLKGAQKNEQELHAQLFAKHRAGLVIRQPKLTPASLDKVLKKLSQTHQTLKDNIPKIELIIDSAEPSKLLQLVEQSLTHETKTSTQTKT